MCNNMRTILEVYKKYKIMPKLQLHQLRVAAVARVMSNAFIPSINEREVTLSCLLHDMGNIIKFDLLIFPDALEPEGLEYWQGVQADFCQKYGNDEHVATTDIARELRVSESILQMIESVGFSKAVSLVTDPSLEKKVCCYADYRVSPSGIVSLEESFIDRAERYKNNPRKISSKEFVDQTHNAFRELERQIFFVTSISPEDINESRIADILKKLEAVIL